MRYLELHCNTQEKKAAEKYAIRIANDLTTRQKAYQLVHDQYVASNYIQPQPSCLWLPVHLALPNTVTIIAEKDTELVGTLSLIFDSDFALPADDLYKKELHYLRKRRRVLAEVISFAVKASQKKSSQDLHIQLMNYAFIIARHLYPATDFVITVNPHHATFYKKKLCFSEAGPELNYKKVGNAPAVLLRLPLEIMDRAIRKPYLSELRNRTLYQHFLSPEEEQLSLPLIACQLLPMSEKEFEYFFLEKTDVWEQTNSWQKEYLSYFYPGTRVEEYLKSA